MRGGGLHDVRQTVGWRLTGGDRVDLVVGPSVHVRSLAGSEQPVHIGEVVVDLRHRIVLRGSCPAVITAYELARFTREVGELLDAMTGVATLRSYDEVVSLIIEVSEGQACLSGFIGHSFLGSLSFNDLEVPVPALEDAYAQLREIAHAPSTPP